MKKAIIALGVLFMMSGQVVGQTVDEVIAKYLDARGGKDKILAVQTMTGYGKIFGGGMEIPSTYYWKRPSMFRYEMSIGGKAMVQAFDGKTGWFVSMRGNGDAEKMPDEMLKEMDDQGDQDGCLVDYKDKGHGVELVGTEDLDGAPAFKIKVTLKNGNIKFMYIDSETWLVVKETSKVKQQGAEIEVDTYLSNYGTIEGLVMPMSFESKMGSQTVSQIGIDSIKFNLEVKDSLFAMPAPKKADSTAAEKK